MYDAGNNSWLNVAPMLSERQLAAAVTWNGKVVVAGGRTLDAKQVFNSAEQYDPESNQWTTFSNLNTARSCHALVNADNTLFAIGGGDGKVCLRSVERYNAESGEWQQAPELKIACDAPASATFRVCLLYFFRFAVGFSSVCLTQRSRR
jgi:N-acetylneuraminic acid mutarotase